MFGISFSELLLIMILGVIIFGPEQLPQIAQKVGKLFFATQNILTKIRQDIYIQTGLSELEQTKNELNNVYNQVRASILDNKSSLSNDSIAHDLLNYSHNQYYEYTYYQPELDFERQPELFDRQ